jgi:phosphopantothenoylcysteine decarboxylase/phosphopantothenate--cysteine ligase
MEAAVSAALPADAAVLVAAVADWAVEPSPSKLKKSDGPPALVLESQSGHPPRLAASHHDLRF